MICSERTVIKFSLCGTAREVFVGRISLRKKELSNDYGLKSRAVQTAINNAKQWQHQQPFVPTWAVRSRATCFPNGQQTRNLKHYPYDCSRNTLGKPEPHPHGEMIECSVGVATASRLRLAIPGARVRSLQDRSNNRAFGGPRKTNQFTLLLTWKSTMWALENARLRKSGVAPVGVECAKRVVLLRVRCFAPDKKALSRSALFGSAGSTNSKPKTRFWSVCCCLVKTSGGAGEREEEGKLSVFSFKRTHVGLEDIGLRRRFQSWNMNNVDV